MQEMEGGLSFLTAPASTNNPQTSVSTTVPESKLLDGGILLEEPYSTEAYDHYSGEDAHLAWRQGGHGLANIPNLINAVIDAEDTLPEETFADFDTNKVAKRGTLQRRLKTKHSKGEIVDDQSDVDIDDQLGKLKLRRAILCMDIGYLSVSRYILGEERAKPSPPQKLFLARYSKTICRRPLPETSGYLLVADTPVFFFINFVGLSPRALFDSRYTHVWNFLP